MTRRQLLRILMQSGVSLPFINSVSLVSASAKDPLVLLGGTLPSIEERKIVLIRLFGGNDGLNTVVPYLNDTYYKVRHEKAQISCAIQPHEVLPLNNHTSLGLHPTMKGIHELYSENKVAVIQNVGYPHQDLSHFRSTDIWLTASDYDTFDMSGWMGRYLEGRYTSYINNTPPFPPAIEYGSSIGRLLIGKKHDMGFAFNGMIGIPEKNKKNEGELSYSKKEQNYINEVRNNSHNFLTEINTVIKRNVTNTVEYYSENRIADELSSIARLIAGGLQTPVYSIITDLFFDNHENLLGYHYKSLKTVMENVYLFQRDLENLGVADKVLVVLFSEFGRRVAPNGSGTDHGAAGPMFIIGNNVKGGVYGFDPDLDNLDENGNLMYQYDFRQIYAELLSDWFGADMLASYPQLFRLFPQKISFLHSSSSGKISGGMAIFPNPCYNELRIQANSTIGSVQIYGVDGERVRTNYESYGQYGLVINVSGLPTGTYVISVRTADSVQNGTFTKL